MKWSDHRRVTNYVCKVLGIDDATRSKLVENVILPDRVHEGVRHHSRQALSLAWKHIRKARRKYLRGEDFTTELAMGLHYIQDYVINPKFLFFNVHDGVEKRVHDELINANVVREGAKLRQPAKFRDRLMKANRFRNPRDALDEATYLTASAIAVVLNPEREGYDFKSSLIYHLFLTIPIPVATLLFLPKYLPLALLISYALHKLDKPFHNALLERFWFGGKEHVGCAERGEKSPRQRILRNQRGEG